MKRQPVVLIAFYQLQSMAVRILDAALRRADIPVHTLFFKQIGPSDIPESPTSAELDALAGLVKQLDPMLVGISLFSAYSRLAAQISERIRQETGALIVWGGPHPTVCPEQCLQHADAVCIGEGEAPLTELATALRDERPFHNLRNLWFKLDGRLIRNELRPLLASLDWLPFPTLAHEQMHYIDRGRRLSLPPPGQIRTYPVMTSRGCPFRCSYCQHQTTRELFAGLGPYLRRHSVGYVIEELRGVRRQFPNLEGVSFWDDVFTCDANWLGEFTERYRAEIGLPFFCYCHPLMTPRPVVEMLKRAGVSFMVMGIQSGSARIRNGVYHRDESDREIIDAAETLRAFDIDYSVDLILGNPLETAEDHRKTLDLLLSLPRPMLVMTHAMTHLPDTALTQALLERNVIGREDVEDRRLLTFSRKSYLLDLHRGDEDLFWDCLFYMAGKRSFSAGLIRRLSHSPFARRHPRALARLLRWTTDFEQTMENRSPLSRLRVLTVRRLLKVYHRLQDCIRQRRRLRSARQTDSN